MAAKASQSDTDGARSTGESAGGTAGCGLLKRSSAFARRRSGILHPGHLVLSDAEVALVSGVARVGGGEPVGDGEPGLVVLSGGAGVAGGDREVAQLVVADAEAALVVGVAGVGGGEPLEDGEAGLVVLGGGG